MGLPTATVKMCGPDGMDRIASMVGTGPVDAAYKAIDSIVQVPAILADYNVSAVTEGIDAQAKTRVTIRPRQEQPMITTAQGTSFARTFTGNGADEDIVVSSARAYVNALNKFLTVHKNANQAKMTAGAKAVAGKH